MSHPAAAQVADPGGEWYALFVRGGKESMVRDLLSRMGFPVLLPQFRRRVIRRGRRLAVMRPLFPNYLFVATDLARDDRLAILRTPHVHRLLGYGDEPAPIPPEQIESLRRLLDGSAPLQPHPYLREGDRVRITTGPFRNVVGLLLERRGQNRLVVSIEVVNRAVSLVVDPSDVEPYE